MASNKKEVEIKVATDVELEKVKALEDNIRELKKQKILLEVEANTKQLDATNEKLRQAEAKLAGLQNIPTHLGISVDDEEIIKAEAEVQFLKEQSIALEIAVDKGQLEAAAGEIEELDGKEIHVDLQTSMQNVSQGITQAKQGVADLAAGLSEVQQAGMQSEQNLGFLAKNLPGGMSEARQQMQAINDIVASMPGDDNTMRSVLSTAQALGNNLNPDEMKAATATMADYMQGSATMGKQALESQQDIMKYLLDGNTAELERGSIVSSQVDKLKQATTFQERQAAMQQVLNDLGYGGISQLDTTINKQAEWEGMIFNSQDALSSMWLGAEKGAMDYILKLNDATGGILGLGIVAGQMAAGPLIDMVSGLGQIGVGLKGLREGITILKDLELVSKLAAAGQWLLNYAEMAWNAITAMNPIMWVVIALVALAAAAIWAYQNVDWFREIVDNAFASLTQFAQQIYGVVAGALQWLGDLFNQFTQQIGLNTNDWLQAILGFILFIPTLPLQVGIALVNTLAKTLGFGNNFVQGLVSAASNAVSGFLSYITQIPQMVLDEFNRTLQLVNDFINSLPQRVWDMGVAIIDALKSALGIGSPGHMYYMMEGELNRIKNLPGEMETDITGNMSKLGSGIVDSFNPSLDGTMNAGLADGSIAGQVNNFYISDNVIDDDARMDKICDAIAKRINWNNVTAGRTV